jgi:hypothetical protein
MHAIRHWSGRGQLRYGAADISRRSYPASRQPRSTARGRIPTFKGCQLAPNLPASWVAGAWRNPSGSDVRKRVVCTATLRASHCPRSASARAISHRYSRLATKRTRKEAELRVTVKKPGARTVTRRDVSNGLHRIPRILSRAPCVLDASANQVRKSAFPRVSRTRNAARSGLTGEADECVSRGRISGEAAGRDRALERSAASAIRGFGSRLLGRTGLSCSTYEGQAPPSGWQEPSDQARGSFRF